MVERQIEKSQTGSATGVSQSGPLVLLPLLPPATMTLDRRIWREALNEATCSYGQLRCLSLYLLILLVGIGITTSTFILLQWLLDVSKYAIWAWSLGAVALVVATLLIIVLSRLLLRGPKRHLAVVLEVRGIVLCGGCGYRIEDLPDTLPCPECGRHRVVVKG